MSMVSGNTFTNDVQGADPSSSSVEKISARFDFTLADLKSINSTYSMTTGANGQHTVLPYMTTAYNKGGIRFTPATPQTFQNEALVTTVLESTFELLRDADIEISYKLANFADNDVDNNSQGVPQPVLIVGGVREQMDASMWSKNNGYGEIVYEGKAGDIIQLGLVSGNVDGGDTFAIVDNINETDVDFDMPDNKANIMWIKIKEI